MLRQIDDSVKSWQRPGMQRRLVFALLGVLIALSYALLLPSEEAQAKGGNQSPNGGSAEKVIGGSAQPAQEVAGEANKLVSNEGAGGKEVRPLAARDSAPRADKPAPVDYGPIRDVAKSPTTNQVADKAHTAVDLAPETNPPVVERTGSLGEVDGRAREATRPAVEPALDEATSVVKPVLEGETKPPRAEPILDEATTRLSKAEPILEETAKPEIAPVLNRATAETTPVLERATAPARPVLEETSTTIEPLLDTASSKIEPVLDGAIPATAESVGEVVGSVARPLGEKAMPTAGPVPQEAAFPGVEPAIEAVAPVFEPVSETVAPVVGSGFGEGIVRQSAGPPVLEGSADAISALPSPALAVETRGVLVSARDYGPVRDEPPASAVEPLGARSGLFDGSFAIDGSHAALLGAIMAKDVREGTPLPFPFGFPPAAPPVGISFGSSGPGLALDLLAVLALLPVLSRVGGLSRSTREAFTLGSSLRLAVERPG